MAAIQWKIKCFDAVALLLSNGTDLHECLNSISYIASAPEKTFDWNTLNNNPLCVAMAVFIQKCAETNEK